MPSEMIEVHYTCGCKATGLRATVLKSGVPNHCPAHGTLGDDMRMKDSGAESMAEGVADGPEQAAAPELDSEVDAKQFDEQRRRDGYDYSVVANPAIPRIPWWPTRERVAAALDPPPDSTDEPPATDPATPEGA